MIKKIIIPNPEFIDDVASLRVAFIDSNADVLEYSTTFEIQKVVPISNICFPAGTPIETDQGIIVIDKINVEKNTINNKKIVAITETVSLDSDLVFFPTNSLGPNIPSQPTAISNNHLVQNPSTNEMIKAKDMGDFYCIPADNRDLNYRQYFVEGQDLGAQGDYTSLNTRQLSVESVKEILLELSFVKEVL